MNDLEELADFLEARTAEDEAVARKQGDSIERHQRAKEKLAMVLSYRTGIRYADALSLAAEQLLDVDLGPKPILRLRECEAKRLIIAHLRTAIADAAGARRTLERAGPDDRYAGALDLAATRTRQAVECIAKHVAQVYADHEQFREEWQE